MLTAVQIFCQLQFLSLYFLSTKYFSATLSGIGLLAITGMVITPAAVVGILLARQPQYSKWLITGGWLLTTLVGGCSILLNTDTPTVGWVFLFLIAGLGHGLLLSSYNIRIHGVSQDVSQDGIDTLSTRPMMVSLFMRAWGMAAAVPVGGVVFMNTLGKGLQNIGLHSSVVNSARGYLILANQISVPDDQRLAIQDATVLALQVVWEVVAGVSAVGGISSLMLWKRYTVDDAQY